MVYVNENWAAVVESVGACKYGTMVPPTLGYEEVVEGLRLTCGLEYSVADLEKLGERVVNLQRMYNVRLGIRRADDTLPERLLKEPAPDGPARGHVVELDYMLDEYYRERGWREDGVPTRERLLELGLPELVRDLEGVCSPGGGAQRAVYGGGCGSARG
jgi:aldehyde:ferredoxin oxidoreductase